MINLYCFHSPMVSSVGFQRAAWRLENGKCRKLEKDETEEFTWKTLCGSGSVVLCLDTASTRLLAVRELSGTAENNTGWRLNFLLEADGQDLKVLPGVLAALLNDKAAFCTCFASLFSVIYEGGEHYELDKEGFIRFVDQLRGEDLPQALQQIHAAKLIEQLQKGVPDSARLFPGRLNLLIPSVTEEYFFQYSELKLKEKPVVCISADTWNALLAHKPVEERSENAAEKPAAPLQGASDEDLRNTLLLLGAVVLVGGLIWSLRKRKN